MKQIQKRSNKKKILIATIATILIAGAATASVFWLQKNQKIEQPASSTANQSAQQATTPTNDSSSPKTPVESDAPTTPTDQLAASITAANQNGSTLQIRTLIETVATSGTCSLRLTKDTTQVTRSAEITPLAHSSTCQGFDIPTAELSPGKWSLTIDITVNNQKATLSQEVTIL